MKQTVMIFTTLTSIILMFSFTVKKNTHTFIGTYGVSNSDPAQIKLTLRSDNSFYFQDFSVSDKKIVVSGTWSLKGTKVYLNANNSLNKFHNVWTFREQGQIAKSRKGLSFYSLCRIND